MTKFPDSESSKVCPGHIPENFVPEHGRTVQLTADTGLGTAEGQALPLGGLEAPAHQGRDARLVSLTPTEWTLAQPSLVSSPPPPLISHSFKTLLLLFRNKQDGREDTSPAFLGMGRKQVRREGGVSPRWFPRVLLQVSCLGARLPVSVLRP